MNAIRYPHSCKYCKNCVPINLRRECFCKYFGRVSSNHICKHYIFNPFNYKVLRKRSFDASKYKEEDFSID